MAESSTQSSTPDSLKPTCFRYQKDLCPGWLGKPHRLELYMYTACESESCTGPGHPGHVEVSERNSAENPFISKKCQLEDASWVCYGCRFERAKEEMGPWQDFTTVRAKLRHLEQCMKGETMGPGTHFYKLEKEMAEVKKAQEAYAAEKAGVRGPHGR